MEKIIFKNYPDTSTPLSAETFNQMQENIEEEFTNILSRLEELENRKVTELYYIDSPEYLSATLTDDISNYDLIIVIGQSSDGYNCSADVYKPTVGKMVSLSAVQVDSNIKFNKQAVYKFSAENIIESIQNYEDRNGVLYEGNYIRLKAVVGLKF